MELKGRGGSDKPRQKFCWLQKKKKSAHKAFLFYFIFKLREEKHQMLTVY